MKLACCSITSANYLPQTLATLESVRSHTTNIQFTILVADEVNLSKHRQRMPNYTWFSLDDMNCPHLLAQYQGNSLRWALKPSLIRKLLNDFDQVIYLDNDLFC